MNIKISSLKEKMRQALTSTLKVISEDFKVKNQIKKKQIIITHIEVLTVDNLSVHYKIL